MSQFMCSQMSPNGPNQCVPNWTNLRVPKWASSLREGWLKRNFAGRLLRLPKWFIVRIISFEDHSGWIGRSEEIQWRREILDCHDHCVQNFEMSYLIVVGSNRFKFDCMETNQESWEAHKLKELRHSTRLCQEDSQWIDSEWRFCRERNTKYTSLSQL